MNSDDITKSIEERFERIRDILKFEFDEIGKNFKILIQQNNKIIDLLKS